MKRLALVVSLLLLFAAPSFAQQLRPPTTYHSADVTADFTYGVMVMNTASAARAVELPPPASNNGYVMGVVVTGANNATVTTRGTNATIDGASSLVVTDGESVLLVADAVNNQWRRFSDTSTVKYATATISSANITGTSAGQLGHANGYELIAAPGAGKAVEVISAVVILDYATAAYGGGGNVTVNYGGGGSALTGAVSAANSLGASGDKIALVLATAPTNNQLSANTGVNLVAASAFTQPGTAAGVVRVKVAYRIHTTGL